MTSSPSGNSALLDAPTTVPTAPRIEPLRIELPYHKPSGWELDAWTSALRSGCYQQGEGSLRKTTGHCCLGVLADAVWHKLLPFVGTDDSDNYRSANFLADLFPDAVQATWENYFSYLNDNEHLTFNQIALVIENVPVEEWLHG